MFTVCHDDRKTIRGLRPSAADTVVAKAAQAEAARNDRRESRERGETFMAIGSAISDRRKGRKEVVLLATIIRCQIVRHAVSPDVQAGTVQQQLF